MTPAQLQQRLDCDTAALVTLIAAIAPKTGLPPADTARIDQLAANLTHRTKGDTT